MLTFVENLAGGTKAVYRCHCGVLTVAFRGNVAKGHTTSCGCHRREVTSERSLTHGHSRSRTKAYVAWMNMRKRCNKTDDKDYPNYGGRGIRVCERWNKFVNFLADMGEPAPDTSLDRIDNDKGYSPDNCRWAPRKVQANNKRSVVRYDFNGKSLTLTEWARETGIGRLTLHHRLRSGVPLNVALTQKRYVRWKR